jgi:hypothetical protein
VPARRPAKPTWSDLKAKLAALDHGQLVALVGDIYRAVPEARTFLEARFALADDPLAVYRATIERWTYPDVYRDERTSPAKAKKAITDYKRAVGKPKGLAELMTVYCEQASLFATDIAGDDEPYLNALVRVFEEALKAVGSLPKDAQEPLLERLGVVAERCREGLGYGVGDAIEEMWVGLDRRFASTRA